MPDKSGKRQACLEMVQAWSITYGTGTHTHIYCTREHTHTLALKQAAF